MSGTVKSLDLHHEQPAAQQVKLQEIEGGTPGENLYNGNLNLIKNLKVKLEVFVGGAEISVGELFDLKENAVLNLDRSTNEPLELRLDGKPVARGNLVAIGDNFGICISEIAHGQAK